VDTVRGFAPDVIVWHHHHPVPHFQDVAALGIPSLQPVALHWSWIAWMPEADLRALTSRDHYVVEGVGVQAYARTWLGIPPERTSTVCIGLDLDLRDRQLADPGRPTRADLGIPDDAFVLASVGQLRFVKGADLLVQAAAELKRRHPDREVKVIWVGGRPSKFQGFHGVALLHLIEELGLVDDVVLVGEQPCVYPYLDLCDVYVQAARDDPFPHATMEAMALGKPVVSFAQGIALEDYAAGCLVRVDVTTPPALADAIDPLLDDADRRAALGRAGLSLVADRMDVGASVRAYEEVLDRVAAIGRAPAPAPADALPSPRA
jgi:D-inositol-3-phosphate glycosyltransferase